MTKYNCIICQEIMSLGPINSDYHCRGEKSRRSKIDNHRCRIYINGQYILGDDLWINYFYVCYTYKTPGSPRANIYIIGDNIERTIWMPDMTFENKPRLITKEHIENFLLIS